MRLCAEFLSSCLVNPMVGAGDSVPIPRQLHIADLDEWIFADNRTLVLLRETLAAAKLTYFAKAL